MKLTIRTFAILGLFLSAPAFSQTSILDQIVNYDQIIALGQQRHDDQSFRLNCSSNWFEARKPNFMGTSGHSLYAPFDSQQVDALVIPIEALKRFEWREAKYHSIDNAILTIKNIDIRFKKFVPILNDFEMGRRGYNEAESVVFSLTEMREHAQRLRAVLRVQKSFLDGVNIRDSDFNSVSQPLGDVVRTLDANRTWSKRYLVKWNSPLQTEMISSSQPEEMLVMSPFAREFCRNPNRFLHTLSGEPDPKNFSNALAWNIPFEGIFHSLETEKPRDVTYPIKPYRANRVQVGSFPEIDTVNNQVIGIGAPIYRDDLYKPLSGRLKDLDLGALMEGINVADNRLEELETLTAVIINNRPQDDTYLALTRRYRELLRLLNPLSDDIMSESTANRNRLGILRKDLAVAETQRSTALDKRAQSLQEIILLRASAEQAGVNSDQLRGEISVLRGRIDTSRADMSRVREQDIPADTPAEDRRELLRERTEKLQSLRLSIRDDSNAIDRKRSQLVLLRDSERGAQISLAEHRSSLSVFSIEIGRHGGSVAKLRSEEKALSSRLGELEEMTGFLEKFKERGNPSEIPTDHLMSETSESNNF